MIINIKMFILRSGATEINGFELEEGDSHLKSG